MAGVYKRLWLQDRARPGWLEKSGQAYRQAWERSRKANVYVGVNAAAVTLWLGRSAESRILAGEVRSVLRQRIAVLAAYESDPDLVLNYWDQVILAEVGLLLGELEAARRLYREAFDRHSERQASIQVAQRQMGEHLRALGLPDDPDVFLGRGPVLNARR